MSYFKPGTRNNITLVVVPCFSDNPWGPIFSRQGDYMMLQQQNFGHFYNVSSSIMASWFPVKWLEISPYIDHFYKRYDTPSQRIRFGYLRFGGGIGLTFDDLEIRLSANYPTKSYDGDLMTRATSQYNFKVQYKIRNWSLAVDLHYSGDRDYTRAILPDFRYYDSQKWTQLTHQVMVTASYRFSVGRARAHDGRLLNESGTPTSGLNDYNTLRGPQ